MKPKVFLLKGASLLTSLAPLAVYLGINYEQYFMQPSSGWTCGAFIAVFLGVFALKDKMGDLLKNNAQLKLSVAMLIIFWFVRSISDTILTLAALSAGGGVLALIPNHFAKKADETALTEKQAEALGQAISNAEWRGGGRV